MKETNISLVKSFDFAVRIVKLAEYLRKKQGEFVLSKQILRSGTSIGANMEEADGAQTKKDFLTKISIAYKETRETHYWLRLLKASGSLSEKMAGSMLADCDELLKIIGAIKHTVRKNIAHEKQ